MPHENVLSGLMKNLLQASQIVTSHPLETLPDVEEANDEDAEFTKKKKIIQTIIHGTDIDKEKIKESEASNTLRKVSLTPMHRLRNVMFKKMLLKLVLYFYDERMKERNVQESFCDFIFGVLLKKYIMKKAAESKYHHLLASCVKYKSIIRVRVFGRFLGLYDEFDSEDLTFYIECLQFLQNSPSGIFATSPENIDSILVPYVRCMECIKYFEKILPKNEIPAIRGKLEKMKREDKLNKLGVVDIDEFLEQLVESHNDHNKSTKHFMDCIYSAGDLNDDGYLQYKELELLMRFLSQIPFSENVVKRIFDEYAETFLSEEDEEVRAISFENLCQLNVSHKLFVAASIRRVTGVKNGEEALVELEKLEEEVEEVTAEIYWRFSESQAWDEHMDELDCLLGILKQKIYSRRNPEKTYLAFCLMFLESKRLIVEERLKELVPGFALGILA